ncbi:TniQ family protein [Streptomyces sp. NPDC059835]|uniref:TniQ family protein n=1 Tax=Streptomyces sp. NPDC059835 TaxID=3346967 RepID=UPI003657C346
MTDRRNRQFDRAVRDYQRAHPGTTLPQAREIVAARAGRQDLPDRIPAAPLPKPGETLAGYIKRVAAAAGVHRHRAMELLGLEPGTSATARLDELTAGLPETVVRALCAATGMTSDQAHALTAPTPAADRLPTLAEQALQLASYRPRHGKTSTSMLNTTALLAARMAGLRIDVQRGGEDKTTADASPAIEHLLGPGAQRAVLVDTDPPGNLDWARPAPASEYTPVLIDTPWPSDGKPLPTDPALFDTVARELGVDLEAQPSKKPGTRPRNDRM